MVKVIEEQTLVSDLNLILDQLEMSSRKMEVIVQEEREAAHFFAGERLEQLFDDRARCQSELVEVESRCRRMMTRLGVSDQTTLEQFIDIYAADDCERLQQKRLDILQRLESVRLATNENKILLHAAWSVTNHVLHEVGALPAYESYGMDVAAYGGVR